MKMKMKMKTQFIRIDKGHEHSSPYRIIRTILMIIMIEKTSIKISIEIGSTSKTIP